MLAPSHKANGGQDQEPVAPMAAPSPLILCRHGEEKEEKSSRTTGHDLSKAVSAWVTERLLASTDQDHISLTEIWALPHQPVAFQGPPPGPPVWTKQATDPPQTTWRFMGSYNWGYKSPNMGYTYGYPTYNPNFNYP